MASLGWTVTCDLGRKQLLKSDFSLCWRPGTGRLRGAASQWEDRGRVVVRRGSRDRHVGTRHEHRQPIKKGGHSAMGTVLSLRGGVAALAQFGLRVSMVLCPVTMQGSLCPMQASPTDTGHPGGSPSPDGKLPAQVGSPSPRQIAPHPNAQPQPQWAAPYRGGQLHTVVEVPEPEEVGEAVSDVKGTQFLVSQSQKPENVRIVLVSPD